jgi:hypothetical protein
MRSAKAPTMRAGVMMAKVIWNINHSASGMVPHTADKSKPAGRTLSRAPTKLLRFTVPSCNAEPREGKTKFVVLHSRYSFGAVLVRRGSFYMFFTKVEQIDNSRSAILIKGDCVSHSVYQQ